MTAASLVATTAMMQPNASRTAPGRYVRVPQRLLTSAIYHPLPVGVYSLVARLFLIIQAPVALSAADLTRYDPLLSRGAAQRALSSLVDDGWLIANERSGQKSTYLPTWGRVNGAPLCWKLGAPCFDRPRHVRAVCLDIRLFDLFFGKLTPHPKRAAVITSYFTVPLLTLSDVGSYALLLGGLPGATPSLINWGIAHDEQPLPLPDDKCIMSLVSQQRLFKDDAVTLTARGLQKLGFVVPPQTDDSAQPLFFVPPEVIDNWPMHRPTNVIDQMSDARVNFDASQSQKANDTSHSIGITWDSRGTIKTQEDSPSNLPTRRQSGGGGDHVSHKKRNQEATQPETASARLLRSIHAFPSSITELAEMPLELVERAIAYAEAEPGIESIPGWVVEALRKQRDQGWPIPAPRRLNDSANRERPLNIEHYTSGAYGDLFRRGSDISGLEEYSVDPEEGSFGTPSVGALAATPEESAAHEEACSDPNEVPNNATARPYNESADDALTRQVQEELKWRCGRQHGRVIAGLRAHVAGDATLLICATSDDMAIVQHELIGAIQCILVQLGAPPQLVFTTHGGWEARSSRAGNARSGSAPQKPSVVALAADG